MANTYRLYNEDVKNGLVDFNDEHYMVLKDNGEIGIILNTNSGEFVLASGIQYEFHNSICWAYGKYYDDIVQVTEAYQQSTQFVHMFLNQEGVSWETIEGVIHKFQKTLEASGISEDASFLTMLDLTIQYLLENPEEAKGLHQDLLDITGYVDPKPLMEKVLDLELTREEAYDLYKNFRSFYRDPEEQAKLLPSRVREIKEYVTSNRDQKLMEDCKKEYLPLLNSTICGVAG